MIEMWYAYLIGLIEPILHGTSNVLDSYLTNEVFKKLSTIVFYNIVVAFLFLPLVFFFGFPQIPPVNYRIWIIFIALVEVFYIFPYSAALRETDVSIVCALFSIEKLFIPIMAFIFVGEKLMPMQYLAFIVIILSSLLLSIDDFSRSSFKINKGFFYMSIVAVLLGITVIMEKYLLNDSISFVTLFFWSHLLSVVFVLPFLLIKSYRDDIRKSFGLLKKNFPVFSFQAFLDFGGNAGSMYTLSLLPATITSGIAGTQPLFVILISYIYSFFNPKIKEKFDKKALLKKIFLFILILIGIIILIKYE